ncbi:MAG: YXWGXW repeat-containing protein [Candidatus Acidiferrum sp.]
MRKISFYSIRLLTMALALGMIFVLTPRPTAAHIAVGVFVNFAPPELPVYAQPVCPGDNYIWTPGYWAWDPNVAGYYWVPGTWVLAPQPGLLWTPGYWGWGPDGYFFNAGYWGPVVGFYGGIDYGFGYFGHGYYGGHWDHAHFFYNRDVTNVNVNIVHNVYNQRVNNEFRSVSRVSFNGGRGGVNARPTAQEQAAVRDRHFGPVAAQTKHLEAARSNRQLRASVNHGAPPIAATQRPNEFSGRGVISASKAGAVYTPPARSAKNAVGQQNHATRPQANSPRHQTYAARANSEGRGRYVQAAHRPESSYRPNPRAANNSRQQHNQQLAQQQRQRQASQLQQRTQRQQTQRQHANYAPRQQTSLRNRQQARQPQPRYAQQSRSFQQRQQPREVAQRQAPRQQPQAHEERRPH